MKLKITAFILFTLITVNVMGQGTITHKKTVVSKTSKSHAKKNNQKTQHYCPDCASVIDDCPFHGKHLDLSRHPLESPPSSYVESQYAFFRQESLNFIDGQPLEKYNVVVGDFGLVDNARDLAFKLKNQDYHPSIGFCESSGMYRVILGTSAYKKNACYAKEKCKQKYIGAWLLELKD